jgi:hypothetical protein
LGQIVWARHVRGSALPIFDLRNFHSAADPPKLTTVAPSWRAGDTIPLGRRTLRVVEVRASEPDKPRVLGVEDMSE